MAEFVKNEHGLYVPQVRDLHILIDDGGGPEVDFVGYSCILVDENTYHILEQKVKDFCSKHKITSLHAREFKFEDRKLKDMDEYEELYRELFEFTVYELRRANYQRVLSFLTSQKIVSAIFDTQKESFEKSKNLTHRTILGEKYRKLYSHFSFPTLELLKRIGKVDDDMRFYVHIDRRDNFQELAEEMVFLEGNIAASLGTVKKAMILIFNFYKNLIIKMAARVDGIHIADNVSTPIIGIVDAFSNFSYNFAKVVIQGEENSSATEKRKYNIFCDVVTMMSGEDISHLIELRDNIKNGFSFDGKKIVPATEKQVSTFEFIHVE